MAPALAGCVVRTVLRAPAVIGLAVVDGGAVLSVDVQRIVCKAGAGHFSRASEGANMFAASVVDSAVVNRVACKLVGVKSKSNLGTCAKACSRPS